MRLDPQLSHLHVGLQHEAFQPQEEVTRHSAKFKPTLPEKLNVDGESNPSSHPRFK